jgi:spermidine/putrescine transport system substrate-binding protein
MPSLHDPAFLRGMTQSRFGRRDALRLSGLSAVAMALAACGVEGTGKTAASAPAPDAVAKFWAGKTGTGKLDFANWPLYMDPKQPELKKFTAATGITVKYQEVIEEMAPWFAKVQPQLAAGQSIGYDLMVITNGIQFKQFVDSGFLAPLDHGKLTNYVANAAPAYANEAFDKGNVYTVPFTSGITGIAYDPAKTKRPITKLADLWDPAFKGKVGMFSDTQGYEAQGVHINYVTEQNEPGCCAGYPSMQWPACESPNSTTVVRDFRSPYVQPSVLTEASAKAGEH